MTDQTHHFTTKDNKVWARNTYGFEGVAALMSKQAGGMNHLYVGASVKFASPVTASTLKTPAAAAWTRLRHWAPIIGTRAVDAEGELNVFSITYTPPASAADAAQWAAETVKWDDVETSLNARDDAVHESSWWSPADNHWGAEMHIGPCGDGQWSFILSIGHWAGDARGTIPLVDKFLELLAAELNGSATPPVEQLSWGTETTKLPPVATVALKLSDNAADAAALKVESNLSSGKGLAPADAPPPPPMFSRPVGLSAGANASPEPKSFTQRVVLTAEETAAVTKASKAHGATVTETINTILVLSEIETILRTAAKDEAKFAEVKASYDSAVIYPLALTTFNRRNFLSPEYANHDAPKGTPSFAFEGFPTMHNMANLRKCLSINGTSIDIAASPESFWTGAVADTVTELEKLKKSGTPEGYVASQTATNAVIPIFQPAMFAQPAMITTSTGSLTKLKALSRWEPSAKGPLAITKFLVSLRQTSLFPYNTVTYWEWDGQIHISLHSASDFLGAADFQLFEESVKKWVTFIGAE
ncbi:hypothetical protein FIBSPDRAFT_889557 [Athelia psychrophila]|uniref:CoA-dependent acyltransferase n=1 Tax=Athelia psychrophila TaxID=1759441 RepID=A0A166LXT4_9AGAM|nr:hypothetical protein FIBSPDRAFT_889557 [Fibularhizoctonia sp. CBS 109695]